MGRTNAADKQLQQNHTGQSRQEVQAGLSPENMLLVLILPSHIRRHEHVIQLIVNLWCHLLSRSIDRIAAVNANDLLYFSLDSVHIRTCSKTGISSNKHKPANKALGKAKVNDERTLVQDLNDTYLCSPLHSTVLNAVKDSLHSPNWPAVEQAVPKAVPRTWEIYLVEHWNDLQVMI